MRTPKRLQTVTQSNLQNKSESCHEVFRASTNTCNTNKQVCGRTNHDTGRELRYRGFQADTELMQPTTTQCTTCMVQQEEQYYLTVLIDMLRSCVQVARPFESGARFNVHVCCKRMQHDGKKQPAAMCHKEKHDVPLHVLHRGTSKMLCIFVRGGEDKHEHSFSR